jgi:hypothetical protein
MLTKTETLARLTEVGKCVSALCVEASDRAKDTYNSLLAETRHTYRAIQNDENISAILNVLMGHYQRASARGLATQCCNGLSKLLQDVNSPSTQETTTVAVKAVGSVDEMGTRIKALQKASQQAEDGFVMLIYDIPSVMDDLCPNPSPKLWRVGFRLNDSCWVLPTKNLEHGIVTDLLTLWHSAELNGRKVKTYTIEYAESQNEKVREIAREKLSEEIVRIHTSLITRLDSAAKRLDAAREELRSSPLWNEADEDKLECKRGNEVRAIIRQSATLLESAIECAQTFDETENVADLLNALRDAIRSERDAFNAEMRLKKGKTVTVGV